jgi:acetylornithine deacetylase/succinyl-diaminopimelate desuccinylase-like protein
MSPPDELDRLGQLTTARFDQTLDLLTRLVAEPSIEGSPAISRCLDIVAEEVGPLAVSMQRPAHDGLESLLARFGHAPSDNGLILAGHVDVVPAGDGWETAPFKLTQKADRVFGRGVCDMKGGVAGFVCALHALAEADLLQRCSIELILTGDEEVGSRRGMIALLDHRLVSGRWAVCGEPTGLDVFLGNRGLVWLEISVRGRGGHAGVGNRIANPVPVAAQVVSALHRLPLPAIDKRFDPPTASLNVTRLDAGAALHAVNVIPDVAKLGVDRRLLPGEDPDEAVAAIRHVLEEVVVPPFDADLIVLRTWPPYVIEADEPVAVAALQAVRQSGRPAQFGADLAADDSSWLSRAGIPSILLGPGAPEQAHATGESLPFEEVRQAAEIYARMAVAMTKTA